MKKVDSSNNKVVIIVDIVFNIFVMVIAICKSSVLLKTGIVNSLNKDGGTQVTFTFGAVIIIIGMLALDWFAYVKREKGDESIKLFASGYVWTSIAVKIIALLFIGLYVLFIA